MAATPELSTLLDEQILLDEGPRDMPTLIVPPERLAALCRQLHDDPAWRFDFLSDIGGVDYLNRTPRFEVVYHLYSLAGNRRLRLKCPVEAEQPLPTVVDIWPCANWHEREVYDMFGLRFTAHPDLRRIYMADDFVGHPLRKDFPVRGYADHYNPNGDPMPEQEPPP